MTTDTTATPRANRRGDLCPPWCTVDHDRLVIDGKPQYGFFDAHWSDGELHDGRVMVRLMQNPGPDAEPEVCVSSLYGQQPVFLAVHEAVNMVYLLELAGSESTFTGLLRDAAAAAEGK